MRAVAGQGARRSPLASTGDKANKMGAYVGSGLLLASSRSRGLLALTPHQSTAATGRVRRALGRIPCVVNRASGFVSPDAIRPSCPGFSGSSVPHFSYPSCAAFCGHGRRSQPVIGSKTGSLDRVSTHQSSSEILSRVRSPAKPVRAPSLSTQHSGLLQTSSHWPSHWRRPANQGLIASVRSSSREPYCLPTSPVWAQRKTSTYEATSHATPCRPRNRLAADRGHSRARARGLGDDFRSSSSEKLACR